MDDTSPGGRRRERSAEPRRRRIVLRLSDAEYETVTDRAALAGMALSAWLGERAVAVEATSSRSGDEVLPDLIKLGAELRAMRSAPLTHDPAQLDELLHRVGQAVDTVMRAHDDRRR